MRIWTISQEGRGDFRSVQAAIDAAAPGDTLRLRPGIYKELLQIPMEKSGLRLIGEKGEKTILTFDRSARTTKPDGTPYGTSESSSVTVRANDLYAENITFENSAGPGRVSGQAVALRLLGDRNRFRHCHFLGWQDTLYLSGRGRSYFRDCRIEGSVDFIFGHGAAIFNRCTLFSREPGYLTAPARDKEDDPAGLIFRDCKLLAASDVAPGSVFLGRPWRPYGRTVFIRCWLDRHIRPEGWDNWRDPAREKTAFFAEIESRGPGAFPQKRVPWARVLTGKDAHLFTPPHFLAGTDGWNPE